MKGLYERGYSREEILELFRFIDWVMALPQELEDRFDGELSAFEEERRMKYVTSIERRADLRAKQFAVVQVLEARFPERGAGSVSNRVNQVQDADLLNQLLTAASVVESLDAFELVLDQAHMSEDPD